MKPGLLRHRITLQKQVKEQDELGQLYENWEDLATVWARVEDSSAKEELEAQREVEATNGTVLLRYRRDVDHTMRFIFDGLIYDIKTVSNDALKTETRLTYQKGVRYAI